ncbi:MAG TPA: hypothetical protein VMH32_22830 [Burkholderiales bacterium]|nr:hypothetical protein [Burkholderiales bacterium]
MKPNLQTVVIAVMAVVMAVLFWAVIYFGRDELRLTTAAPQDELPVRSAVTSEEGHAAVRVSMESQRASGIVTRALQPAIGQASSEVYGVVVNLQPLMDLRGRYNAAVADARALRAAATGSGAEYRRVKALYDDERNVSERALQAAEAQWKADQARLAAAEQSAAATRDSIASAWGETLAKWVTDADSAGFDALAQQREALIQLTFPFDLQAQAGNAPMTVAPVSASSEARPARFLSTAPQSDATLPGVTYFYAASAQGLRVGMRVAGQLKLGGTPRKGVIVPAAAVVWHGGKPWVYVKEKDDLFVRKEVSTALELRGGWFNAGGFDADDEVVVSGAQLLLSEELKFQIRNENED